MSNVLWGNKLFIYVPSPYKRLLSPIYDLTKKGREFLWEEHHQDVFETIKDTIIKHPVLYLPNSIDRFQLYSDTSQIAAGGALYQIQGGQPRLVGYASKRLLPVVKRYSITELEMLGLLINIKSYKHYLNRVDFDVIVDTVPFLHNESNI